MGNRWGRWMVVSCFLFLQLRLSGQGAVWIQESFNQKSLSEVFRVLERKYAMRFAYDEEAIAAIKINKRVRAASVEDALDELFKGTGIVYQIPSPGQVLLRLEAAVPSLPVDIFHIKGQVIDGWSGQPLPYAHVLFAADQGVAADEHGYFSCDIPVTNTAPQLQVQYIGYQSRSVVLPASNVSRSIQIRLTPTMEKLPGITVKERASVISRQSGQDGTRMLVPALSRMSFFVGGKDLFRGVQMLPGVNASDDLSADLSIRSSNGDENLVLLDGMTLYNVTHFFGIFSIVNPNVVDRVQVYKNAFPAEYGGRTAAIIDMHTQPMQQDGWRGMVDFNLLTSNAVVDVPISTNMGILAGFRTANQNLGGSYLFNTLNSNQEVVANVVQGRSTARTVTNQQPNFYFNDANVKWTWKPSTQTAFLLSYFRGRDRFSYDFNRTIYPPFRRTNSSYLEEQYLEEARWQNEGFALHWNQDWSSTFRSHATLAHAGYENETRIESTFSRVSDSLEMPRVAFDNIHFNQIRETNIHLKNVWSRTRGQLFLFGYQGAFNRVQFNVEEDGKSPLSGNSITPQHAWYGQYQSGQLFKGGALDVGLRTTFYKGKGYVSPRLFFTVTIAPETAVKASYGRYQQFVRQLYHEDRFGRSFQYWVLSDARFPVLVSNNYMLGATHKHKWFDLDLEFYLKNTDGVMEHALQRTGISVMDGKPVPPTYTLFTGIGKTLGVDVLLQKSTTTYAWWVAYTLSRSTHIFQNVLRGRPFPAPNDRRHQLKLNGQYTMGKFDVGATYIFASGRPYTDLSLLDNQVGDRTQLRPADRIAYLDNYNRIDVYGNYSFPMWRAEGTVGINLYNLTNNSNVKYRQFIYSFMTPGDPGNPSNKNPINTVVGTELEMLGFTPNISFQIKF